MIPAIVVTNANKTFRRGSAVTRALDGVSVGIEQGEMVALIGASGSGKSTLVRHIAGLTRCDDDSGAIDVFGDCMQARGRLSADARRIRSRVGVIFQQFNLVGRLSVMTNVLLGALGRMPKWRATLGWFERADEVKAIAALARVGMDGLALQRASTLSGGQQQRAAIARTLVQEAAIILADEPIASLDPEAARRVMEHLAQLNREDGITVVVSLHQVDFARHFCPRTVALRNGSVVFDGASTALTADFLREIYGAQSEELILAGPLGDKAVAGSTGFAPAPAFVSG